MKLKYYLRGLGVGIIVTAMILSRTEKTEKMTDAQIKMRALELGMVEETVLADLPKAAEEDTKDKDHADVLDEYTAGEAELMDQTGTESVSGNESSVSGNIQPNADKDTAADTAGKTDVSDEKKEDTGKEIIESYTVVTIEPGNGSETVSRRLYNAGLIESAVTFNQYLMEQGFDKKLIAGNHEIPEGCSEEEIAKIICGLQ